MKVNVRKPMTESTKLKISLALKGRRFSEETHRRMSEALRGRCSERRLLHLQKLADVRRGSTRGPLTEEHCKKISDAKRGIVLSKEHREKMSISLRGKHKSEEMRRRLSESKCGIPLSESHRKQISETLRGRSLSDAHRQQIVNGNLRSYLRGRLTPSKCSRSKRTEYSGIWFKSTWETKFAEFLDFHDITWKYEPQVFNLGGATYRPDFYLIGYSKWIEIKGYMDPRAELKIEKFRVLGHDLEILRKADISDLGVL